jgi:hypothetical protein
MPRDTPGVADFEFTDGRRDYLPLLTALLRSPFDVLDGRLTLPDMPGSMTAIFLCGDPSSSHRRVLPAPLLEMLDPCKKPGEPAPPNQLS